MAIKAVGQFTITDLNDAIISGTKPLNPTVDQLWIKRIPDAPDELYSWNGTDWVPQTLSLDTLDADKSKQINDTTDTVTEIVDVVVPELEDAISQKLSITTYDDAVGVNKWVSTVYPISTSINLNTTPPAFDMFKGVSPTSVNEVVDGSTIAIKSGSNQITHLFTRVFLKVAKTISLSMLFDDSIAVYMNGASVYQSKYLGASTRGSASLSLRAGWNTIEILHGQATGTPVLDLGTKISTQVDRFTSVVGVGDKNETRLTRAETEILQTTSQIALKANQTDVTSMGNRISTAEGQLTVQSNQIATKVAQSTFDAYSQRVTTAESNITQLSDQIATKVAQTDYDNLNSKVTSQATTITQMSDSIALKASKTDVDALAGRVSTAETSIVQANNAIALKASQSSLDSVTNRVTTAESNITAQSNQIALKVAKTDMNAMSALNTLHNAEWLTNTNKWSLGTGWTLDTTTKYQTSNTMKQIQSGATSNNYYALQSENISCTVGDVLTGSIYAMTDDYTKFDLGATIEINFYNSSNTRISYPATAIALTSNSSWQRFIVTGTAPVGTTYARLRVHVGKNGRLWVARPMLQTGIFASIFTPHVDELATDLISRVSGAETSIIQTNNAIALKANATDVYTKTEADGKVTTAVTNAKSEIKATTDSISSTVSSISTSVDNLGTKVDSQATEIKQTKDDISLNVVKKDSIVASINASSEGIKMVASKIDLTGAVTINALDDATKAKVTNALDTTASYNGVKIDANNGIVVTKGDGKSRTRLNATEGLKIQKSTDGVNYTDVLYADTAGVLYAKGLVLDNASSLGGTVVSTVVANASSGATANSTIVSNKGTWDRSGNINADGTYNAGKIAGQLSDTQIASSSAWNTATVNVGDMVSDLKISPLEKSQLSRDWESIKAEYAQVTAMATALGVTQTAFVNAYNAFEGTTPKIASEILATMNATYNFASTTTRDAFKAKFTTYYVEKEKLRKLVSDTINSTATTAKTRTDDMISDMKVTPLEKSQLSRDWESIKAEYAQLSAQANALGVTATAYNTSYTNLDAVSPKIATEILASMSATYSFASTTARDLFKTQINTYFAEAQKIRKAISDKIQSNVENVSIGGRNVLPNSSFASVNPYSSVTSKHDNLYADYYGGYNGGITNPTTSYHAHIDINTFGYPVYEYNESDGNRNWKGISVDLTNLVVESGQYSLSLDAFQTLAGGKLTGGFYYTKKGTTTNSFHSGQFAIDSTIGVNSWSRSSALLTLNDDVDWSKPVSFYIYGYGFSSNTIVYMKRPKLEKGNKATEWTPSNEDIQRSLDSINSSATKANNMLADMASDSKITPTEKVQLKKEWATISAEKPTYESLATTYGITTEKTNYVNSYNNLNTTLNGASGVLLDMTVTTSVVGSTFRATFDDYYDKKALLIKKVNETSRSIGVGAQGAIDSNKSTWDRSGNINADGTFNSNKLYGQLSDSQIVSASNWNTAKARTDDMLSDMKVTALEKSQLSRDWESIKAEYAQLLPQATSLGLATTAYSTAYTNLDGTTPKIASEVLISMTTTYTFASATARDLFKTQLNAYFSESQKLRKAISDKIQSNIDNISVGGSNILSNSTAMLTSPNDVGFGASVSTTLNGETFTRITPDSTKAVSQYKWLGSSLTRKLVTDSQYTLSMDVRPNADGNVTLYVRNGANTLNLSNPSPKAIKANVWTRISSTFTADSTSVSELLNILSFDSVGKTLDVRNWMLEKSNVMSDWTPATEDVQALISTATADAKKANDMLTDMASDSKITPTEKVQLKKEWATISAEKATYEALATTYGITTEKTNYVTSYNNLNTALNGTGGVLLDMTTTSTVVGSTFRATFDDYYDKKALLIRKVNEMSRTIGNTAQTTANTAQTTANSKAKTFTSTPTTPYSVGDIWVQGASGDVMHCVTARASGSYTASDWVKSTKYTDDTTANIATEIARGMASGKMIYTDPVFRNGMNGTQLYNNLGNGNVSLTRIAKPADAPTSSAYALEIKTIGTADPVWGGFIVPVQARASAKFIFKIIAKIPVGYTLNVASNSMGTGYTDRIVTSNQGTGKYEEYIRIVQCGTTGTFSGGGHFYLSGGTTPTSTTPLVWNVAYATVYDVADNDSMVYDMVSDMKVTPLEKNQLSRDWEAIKAEYTQVKDQATSVGVSSALITSYNTAYNNLNGSPPRVQTDVLASMSTTYEFASAGARDNFKNQFTAYFTEAEKIKKAINDAINGVAVTADGKINDLKIGGRNLVYNSTGLILAPDGITPDGWADNAVYELAEGQDAIKVSTTLASEVTSRSNQINVKPNTTYAIRASVMGSLTANGFDLHFLGRKNGSDNPFDYVHSFTNMLVNGGYGDYLYTFTTSADEVDGYVRLDNNGCKVTSATTAPTLALVANTGSTLTATTYYVKYTWANDEGETTASTQATLAVTAGNNLRITVPAFPSGVTKAKVYVGTASNVNKYQGDITTSGGNLVISTPIVTTSVAPPTTNSIPSHVWFSEIQLEEGTRNTEWSPSPTDMNVYTEMVKSQLQSDLQMGLSDKVTVMQLGGYATTEMVTNSATEVLATVDERIQNMQLDTFATSSALVQTANDLTVRFQSGGGVNLLKNSVGFADTDLWTSTGNVSTLQNEEISLHGSISAFSINDGNISQDVSVILNQYTISTVVKKDATGTGKINVLNGAGAIIYSYSIDARAYDYEAISFTIDTSATNVMTVQLLADSTATIIFTSTMLNVGDIPLQWQQASGEVYNTNVKMDVNGLKVISNVYDGYTAITPEEFAGYARDDSGTMKKVFTLNKGVTEMTKADIDEEISMGSIKIVPVSEAGSTGWAFIGT